MSLMPRPIFRRYLLALALIGAAAATAAADVVHLLIVGTNDIHGALGPRARNDGSSEGGLAVLTGYVDILRSENPGRVIWLDAGDEFQGSIESNMSEGEPVVSALNAAGVTAAAIGNHEFDFGPVGEDDRGGDPRGALRLRMKQARYPFLGANIVERSMGRSPFAGNSGSVLRTVAGIRVGIIGLATATTPVTTWPPFVSDLEFSDLRGATLREAAALRARGAEVVLLVAHVGVWCAKDAPNDPKRCNGELVDLLRGLPAGTVDAVVSGHSHSVVNARIEGLPVIQAGSKGTFINIIDLPFDRAQRRVVRESVRTEGPIAVRFPAVFHGRTVRPARAVERVLQPVFARTALIRDRVLATAERAVERGERGETAMGDLVTDALRDQSGAEFALMNAGGIRAALPAGPITYGAAFEALPFENKVVVLRVRGRQLKAILRVAESGAMGFFPVAGLRLTINSCERCPVDDLDGDGSIERWETNRLLGVERADGSPIDDDAEYTLATIDFVLLGGDNMAWPLAGIAPDRIRYTPLLVRDALVRYLEKHQRINTASAPLVDAARPRMVFIKRDEPAAGAGEH
jgi:5'-nucleotidase